MQHYKAGKGNLLGTYATSDQQHEYIHEVEDKMLEKRIKNMSRNELVEYRQKLLNEIENYNTQ